jgi:hypothetical protein
MYNEPVEKTPQRSYGMISRGHLTLPNHEIVDPGAFCEVSFFCISSKDLFGDFFYSLNDRNKARGN